MKRWILLSVLLATAFSCGLSEIGEYAGEDLSGGGDVWGGPIENPGGSETMNEMYFMTALDYQAGYDWHSDVAAGAVRCSLVVYADGKPVMKVPVGDEYEVGADPDMHRLIGGHLYTDFSNGSETVIKCDGVELLRYEGCERMCGMEVTGADLYTLGEDRSGRGLSYRRNGEVVFSRKNASVLGALHVDGGRMCFAFTEYITSVDGDVERYYVVCDGMPSQIAVREDLQKIWDIAVIDGVAVYVATLSGVDMPVLVAGENMSAISLPRGTSLISCRLLCVENDCYVDALYGARNGVVTNGIWKNSELLETFPRQYQIASLIVLDGAISCALNPTDTSRGRIYRSGERFEMPSGYRCLGRDAMAMVNGILHVGLSSPEGRKPVVWKDGQVDSIKINGYISAVYSERAD